MFNAPYKNELILLLCICKPEIPVKLLNLRITHLLLEVTLTFRHLTRTARKDALYHTQFTFIFHYVPSSGWTWDCFLISSTLDWPDPKILMIIGPFIGYIVFCNKM